MNTIAISRKIQEAQAMHTPMYIKNQPTYIGFLEMRKTPLVTGLSAGLVAKFTTAMVRKIIPTK
jgi:hypothetical protein